WVARQRRTRARPAPGRRGCAAPGAHAGPGDARADSRAARPRRCRAAARERAAARARPRVYSCAPAALRALPRPTQRERVAPAASRPRRARASPARARSPPGPVVPGARTAREAARRRRRKPPRRACPPTGSALAAPACARSTRPGAGPQTPWLPPAGDLLRGARALRSGAALSGRARTPPPAGTRARLLGGAAAATLDRTAQLHDAALGARHASVHQHEVLVGDDLGYLLIEHADAYVAHLPGHLH